MSPEAMQRSLERLLLQREIEEFVAMEAELLDERRYNEWIELMADDIHYYLPIRRNMRFGEQDREEQQRRLGDLMDGRGEADPCRAGAADHDGHSLVRGAALTSAARDQQRADRGSAG